MDPGHLGGFLTAGACVAAGQRRDGPIFQIAVNAALARRARGLGRCGGVWDGGVPLVGWGAAFGVFGRAARGVSGGPEDPAPDLIRTHRMLKPHREARVTAAAFF